MKKPLLFLLLSVILAGSFSCKKVKEYSVNGWDIEVNSSEGTISFSNKELGTVFYDVRLMVKNNADTTLLKKRIEYVNIEVDIIGKYVEKFLDNIRLNSSNSTINIETLKKYGFIG